MGCRSPRKSVLLAQLRHASPLHYVVGCAAVNVFLILAIGIGAVLAVPVALGRNGVGRIERKVTARRDIRCDDFFVGG